MRRRCWYVSGRMSKIKGGEFFKFIFGCWHNLTTLSINFHVFSKARRSIINFGGAMASVKAPCSLENNDVMFLFCWCWWAAELVLVTTCWCCWGLCLDAMTNLRWKRSDKSMNCRNCLDQHIRVNSGGWQFTLSTPRFSFLLITFDLAGQINANPFQAVQFKENRKWNRC